MTTGCHDGPPQAMTPEQEAHAIGFFRWMHETHGDGVTSAWIAGAIHGYTLREHVDACHPGEVELIHDMQLEKTPEDRRAGFSVGYHYADRGAR